MIQFSFAKSNNARDMHVSDTVRGILVILSCKSNTQTPVDSCSLRPPTRPLLLASFAAMGGNPSRRPNTLLFDVNRYRWLQISGAARLPSPPGTRISPPRYFSFLLYCTFKDVFFFLNHPSQLFFFSGHGFA